MALIGPYRATSQVKFLGRKPNANNQFVHFIFTQGAPPTKRKQFPRLVRGPRLFERKGYQGNHDDYLLSLEKKKANNIRNICKLTTPLNWNRMKCWLQIVSTPTADTPGTTLLLHFDNKRYLIGNVGEGTQRACTQRKLGMAKVKDIFLTGTVGWGTAGGIMGMILTVADSLAASRENQAANAAEVVKRTGVIADVVGEKVSLNLHGGKNLAHLLATARRFIFRKGVPLNINEFKGRGNKLNDAEPTWQDDNIRVWTMVVEPDSMQAGRSRKRSHEEFSDELGMADGAQETVEEREDRYDQMRQSVVASMFDSAWKLDALFKKKLSEVRKGEAKIFYRNDEGHIEEYTGPTMQDDPNTPDIDVLIRNPWPGAKVQTLPPTTPSTSSVCYIFKTQPQRGRFDPKKAQALKVPKGPNYRKLTMGESVIAEDGATITPDMVLGKGREGNGFAVVELPNASYIGPLIAREEWSSEATMNGIGAITWILGAGVLEDSRIQKFMKDHAKLEHFISSADHCANSLALESSASAAIRLHLLDSERFPIPKYNNSVEAPNDTLAPFTPARVGYTIDLQPEFKIDKSQMIPYLDTKLVVTEASEIVKNLSDVARKQVESPEYLEKLTLNQADILCKDAEVITLGTGSALPSKYRNVSATMVRVPGYGSYLFDCGENTLGQLKRVFGSELPEVLRDLKAIWISHLHADHHLGTAAVIKAWSLETQKSPETRDNKLVVASDEAMLQWLLEYSEIEDYGHDRLYPISLGRDTSFFYRFNGSETPVYGLDYIQGCHVHHCHGAMAVVFGFPNGFKIAYSGDCRPSEYFAKIGKGATLLIHEATFDDELQGDAKAKKHSTTSEALEVGRQMGARRILLTHFSQRYQKLPVMDSEGGKEQVAIVAFDYMRCKIGDFAKLEAFKPALMELYKEEE